MPHGFADIERGLNVERASRTRAVRMRRRSVCAAVGCVAIALCAALASDADATLTVPNGDTAFYERAQDGMVTVLPPSPSRRFTDYLPAPVLLATVVLLGCSAFFSGSETAFFSINRLQLRSLREENTVTGPLIAQMMDHPGRLLTTILIGNMIVNTLTGILLGTRVEDYLQAVLPDVHRAVSYVIAVSVCTGLLVFFGEIAPKVFAVQAGERLARVVVFPLLVTDRLLSPVRDGLLGLTNLLFKVTRFHQLRAAPFITDEEFKSALTDGEAQGVIEEDERQMIQGILEFSDAQLREILIPRPDIVALPETATVGEALALYRVHHYTRMPVYRENLDKIVGLLVAKDLLPHISRGDTERNMHGLVRPAHFVPATMTVQQFVRDAQRHRTHLAIVVDEYGGTAGIVTLEDAMEQVVGDIMDEGELREPRYRKVSDTEYEVDGDLPLDDLNELLGIALHDQEHETVAGFVMHRSEKVLEPGDELEYEGVRFRVVSCDGKRASAVRVQVLPHQEAVAEELGKDGVEST